MTECLLYEDVRMVTDSSQPRAAHSEGDTLRKLQCGDVNNRCPGNGDQGRGVQSSLVAKHTLHAVRKVFREEWVLPEVSVSE